MSFFCEDNMLMVPACHPNIVITLNLRNLHSSFMFSDYLAPPGSSSSHHHSHNSYSSHHTPHSSSTHSYNDLGPPFASGYDTVRSRSNSFRSNGNIQDEGGGTLKRDRKYSNCKFFWQFAVRWFPLKYFYF